MSEFGVAKYPENTEGFSLEEMEDALNGSIIKVIGSDLPATIDLEGQTLQGSAMGGGMKYSCTPSQATSAFNSADTVVGDIVYGVLTIGSGTFDEEDVTCVIDGSSAGNHIIPLDE